MMLATIQAEGERTNEKPEAIAVAGISMRMEFDGLVSSPFSHHLVRDAYEVAQYSSVKELLTLSRKMKELWVFGPLGKNDPHRRAKEEQINKDVSEVSRLLGELESSRMVKLAEESGGSWQPLEAKR